MRRVNIITGIKQRLQDILGQGDDGNLTAWSIQSAMLSNFKRLTSALNKGSSVGTVLTGLSISASGSKIIISPGYGITSGGDLVTIPVSFKADLSGNAADDYHICLRYSLSAVPNDTSYGQYTSVINDSGNVQIVYDEFGASDETAVDPSIAVTNITTPAEITADPTLVYIGTVTFSGTVVSNPTDVFSTPYGQVIAKGVAATTVASSVWVVPLFLTVSKNTAAEYDSSTGIYTAASSGFRQVSFKITNKSSTSFSTEFYFWKAQLYLNGTGITEGSWSGFYPTATTHQRESAGSSLVYMDVGDTLDVRVTQNTGVDQEISSTSNDCYLTISTVKE